MANKIVVVVVCYNQWRCIVTSPIARWLMGQ